MRAKIFAVSLSLIALSVLAGEIYLRHSVEATLVDRIRHDLIGRLDLIRDAGDETLRSSPAGSLENRAAWSDLAHRLARSGNGRVTFIRPDGVVLGDSEVDLPALDRLENHHDRPEVIEALHGPWGSSMRWSATVSRRLMYVAVPVERDGKLALIARIAVPLTEVDDALQGLRQIFGFGALIALGVALFLSFGAAHILSRSLRDLTTAARRMSSGDLDVRTHLRGRDEVAELGKALDALAESLSANLSTMRAERDLLGRILESMQEGVLVMDAERRILLVNPSLREMLALSSEAVGRIAIEVIRNAELQRLLETALASEGSHSGEIEIVGPQAAARAGARQGDVGPAGAAGGLRRRHRCAPARVAAPRLRRQRVARAAHADRRGRVGRRDAAPLGAARPRGVGALRRHDRAQRAPPARAGRGRAGPVAHRVQGIQAARRCRRRRADRARR